MPRTALPRPGRRPAAIASLLAALLAAGSVAGSVAVTPAAAQPPAAQPPAAQPPAVAFPDTPLGRLGAELIALLDDGDSVAIRRFVDAHVGTGVLRGLDADTRTHAYLRAHAQSGGLRVERVGMFGPALRVLTSARNGRRWLGFELVPAPHDTARLVAVDLHPMDAGGMRLPPAPWATGALTDEQLAAVVRDHVRQAADSDGFAGVVLVAHGDRILVHEAYGLADQARHLPNTTATRFQTTSVGKMFTGVAVAQLVERGRLSLDDTLARVLPGYPNAETARRVTVRQLLTHTAGVPEPFFSARFGTVPDSASHLALLGTFADAPLDFAPGARFEYSNGNYLTLGALIERASGQRYEDYLRAHVWGPAGLGDVPHPAWSDVPGLATPYARFTWLDPLGVEPRTAAAAPDRPTHPALRGFGGGAYTAEELFRFAHALRTGRLLGTAMTDSVVAGRVPVAPGAPVRYALGFYERTMNGARVVGHPGSNPDTGWDADVELVWDADWTVVVLSNYDAPAGMEIGYPILDLVTRQVGAASAAAHAP
jgi:CubicO group peptidase (beta-lactamase class C family)